MKEYEVLIEKAEYYKIVVQAEDYDAADDVAYDLFKDSPEKFNLVDEVTEILEVKRLMELEGKCK